jgi:hypothetical protein
MLPLALPYKREKLNGETVIIKTQPIQSGRIPKSETNFQVW